MILITGAAGFIGSNLLSRLNEEGITEICIVDDFLKEEKHGNYIHKTFKHQIQREDLETWFNQGQKIDFVFHLGARTDTTEFNKEIFDELNVSYSKFLWNFCTEKKVPIIYASSAATYGNGEFGYADDHNVISKLTPLNPYGDSKNEFDKWVLSQKNTPPFWVGLKFFNVYGPNEYHKGRMASVILHTFNQIQENGKMKLFRSHNPDYKDGEQLRDFIYVRDVVDVIWFLSNHQGKSGIYNLGSGKARSFNDLAKATFKALKKEVAIEYIDTPADIRDKYQYFTEADMTKLRNAGYQKEFSTLEEGVRNYVTNYLSVGKFK